MGTRPPRARTPARTIEQDIDFWNPGDSDTVGKLPYGMAKTGGFGTRAGRAGADVLLSMTLQHDVAEKKHEVALS